MSIHSRASRWLSTLYRGVLIRCHELNQQAVAGSAQARGSRGLETLESRMLLSGSLTDDLSLSGDSQDAQAIVYEENGVTGDMQLQATAGHIWSTYLGGSKWDGAFGVAVDSQGFVYITGDTESSGWLSGGYDKTRGGNSDGFVMKFTSTGEHVWSTYIGGSGWDEAYTVAVDNDGNVYVTGYTESAGWVSGGYDTTFNGESDGFVVKLSSTGQHLWSTYLGGNDDDYGGSLTIDDAGNVYVTGTTESAGWVSGGYDVTHGGDEDAFVVKLSSSGQHIWSTYLGGIEDETGYSIALDSQGNILVTGQTESAGWVSGGYDDTLGGEEDAYVVKLNSDGQHLWSTYVGGNLDDEGFAIRVDQDNNVFLAGVTESSGWVSGGFDTSYNGGEADIFVLKLTSSGEHLWSTYLGGSMYEDAQAMALDSDGNIFIVGYTQSTGWTQGGYDTTFNGDADAFVAMLDTQGEHVWSTYMGGTNFDYATAVAIDPSNNLYVVGVTSSRSWLTGGRDTSLGGTSDGFLVVLPANGMSFEGARVELRGNDVEIVDGDNSPALNDHTDFGSVTVGTDPVTRTFVIHNTGDVSLSLSDLKVPKGFTIVDDLPAFIAAGASASFSVRLDTTTAGTKTGEIRFTTNDAEQKLFNFTITGAVTKSSIEGNTITTTLPVTFIDADGTKVTVSLKGGGSASMTFLGDNISFVEGKSSVTVNGSNLQLDELVFNNTTAKSTVSITTNKAGDGRTTLGSIESDTSLKSLKGKSVDLTDEGIFFASNSIITTLQIGHLLNGADIVMTGDTATKGVTLTIGRIGANSNISVASSPIKTLQAVEWVSGQLTTSRVNTLKITGDKKNAVAGDMGATLNLSNNDPKVRSINTATIAGRVTGGSWNAQSNINSIKSAGFDESWSLLTTGEVKTINAGKGEIAGQITAQNFGTIRTTGGALTAQIIANGASSKGVSISTLQAGRADFATIVAPGSIGTLKVIDWQSGSIEAASIKTLTTTGDKKNSVAGDFNAALVLNDSDVSRTLGTTRIAGSIVDQTWNINGQIYSLRVAGHVSGQMTARSAGTITVLGDLSDFTLIVTEPVNPNSSKQQSLKTLSVSGQANNFLLQSNGHVGSVTVGKLSNSRILVGVDGTPDVLPAFSDDLTAQAKLGKLTVKGIKNEPGASFASSLVLAHRIDQVSLKLIDGENEGDLMGIAATSIGKYSRSNLTGGTTSMKNLTGVGDYDTDADYRLRVVGPSA